MSSLIFSNLCKQSFSIYLMYDLSSSTAYKTTDTLDKTFASPAILAYGDIHIKAKELLNRLSSLHKAISLSKQIV